MKIKEYVGAVIGLLTTFGTIGIASTARADGVAIRSATGDLAEMQDE